jgi:hypothetical protein
VYHLISGHPGLSEPSKLLALNQSWKAMGIKHLLVSRTFLIGKVSDKRLPTRTVLQVLFRQTFITFISFMGILNSVRILYKTSLRTELKAFWKSVNNWCTASLYSHFSQVSDKCRIYNRCENKTNKCLWKCVYLLHYTRCKAPTCFGHLLWSFSDSFFCFTKNVLQRQTIFIAVCKIMFRSLGLISVLRGNKYILFLRYL